MENLKETFWYNNLDWSMIWVCIIAVIVHILFLENNKSKSKNPVKYTFKNYAFYLLSSLLVLTFISEVGLKLINYFWTIPLDLKENVDHFLAALSGLGGGYITTRLIKLFQKTE